MNPPTTTLALYRALAAGPKTTNQLIAELGISRKRLHTLMGKRTFVKRLGRGLYTLTEAS